MQATTDFTEWLSGIELDDHNDIYSLYHSVEKCEEWGGFKTVPATSAGDRWIVTYSCSDQPLLLASEKAKQAFLKHIEMTYCGDFKNIEGYYAYCHAMAKDD